jgi:hypothetical protein
MQPNPLVLEVQKIFIYSVFFVSIWLAVPYRYIFAALLLCN